MNKGLMRVKLDYGNGQRRWATLPQLDAVVVMGSKEERLYFRRTGPADYRLMNKEDAEKLVKYLQARRLKPQQLTLKQVDDALKGRIIL
jgi:hypothetical protein